MKAIKTKLAALRAVSTGTWLRLILLAAALAAVGVQLFGSEAQSALTEKVISFVVMLLSAGAGYWKNNSFTEAAQAADDILLILREQTNK